MENYNKNLNEIKSLKKELQLEISIYNYEKNKQMIQTQICTSGEIINHKTVILEAQKPGRVKINVKYHNLKLELTELKELKDVLPLLVKEHEKSKTDLISKELKKFLIENNSAFFKNLFTKKSYLKISDNTFNRLSSKLDTTRDKEVKNLYKAIDEGIISLNKESKNHQKLTEQFDKLAEDIKVKKITLKAIKNKITELQVDNIRIFNTVKEKVESPINGNSWEEKVKNAFSKNVLNDDEKLLYLKVKGSELDKYFSDNLRADNFSTMKLISKDILLLESLKPSSKKQNLELSK
jgi:hypothetical protein